MVSAMTSIAAHSTIVIKHRQEQPMSHQTPNHLHHQDVANHHEQAARHHEQAAKSHLEAARLRAAGNQETAANHALTAHGFALHALHHSEESIKMLANMQASVQRP